MSRQTSDKEKRARKTYASDDPSSAVASNPQAAYRARQKVRHPAPHAPPPNDCRGIFAHMTGTRD